jgi:ABC-type multidrug transport system fused ATPase/permease subunit
MDTGEDETQQNKLTPKDIAAGLRVIVRLLRPYKRNMVIFILFGILISIASALLPYIVGLFVDALVSPESVAHVFGSVLPMWLAILLLWAVVRLTVILLQDHIWRNSSNQSAWIYSEYLVNGFGVLARLPLSFHKTHKIGEIISKVNTTANQVGTLVGNVFLELGPQVLTIIAALIMTFVVHPGIGLVLLGAVVFYGLFFWRGVSLLGVLQTKVFEVDNNAWGDAGDYLHNIRQVKEVSGEELVRNDLYQKFRVKACSLWERMHTRSENLSLLQELTMYTAQLIIFFMSVHFIFAETMTIGQLLAVNSYAALVFGPFGIITRMWKNLQNGIVNINETEKILAHPQEVCTPKDVVPLTEIRGDVSFEHVSFGYDDKRLILKDISFESKAGQTIAIVGESGVGKTTLVDLILGFLMPTEGKVYIDGVPTDRIDLHLLRKHVAIVTQDIVLFNDTVSKNIAFGLGNVTKESIERAAERASAREFIEAFADGWEQVVGERGIKLSGGQRQRIAIARAILKDPKILILDEPTSALDARTEHALQQSFEQIMAGKTTFIIAHRFSTVRGADTIIVLKGGAVVQQGTHTELIAEDGEYKHLYDLQIGLRE